MVRIKKYGIIPFLLLILIYIIDNFSQAYINQSLTYLYIGKPILWLTCGCITVFALSMPKIHGKLKFRNDIITLSVAFAFFYIAVQVSAGFLCDFGKSPYSLTPIGILRNTIAVLSSLIGKELLRRYSVNLFNSKIILLPISVIALILTFIDISLSQIIKLDTNIDMVKFWGATFLPSLSENILASYLAYIAGFWASFSYMGILQTFHWYSPILPNLSWIIKSLLGTLIPFFTLVLIQHVYLRRTKVIKDRMVKQENAIGKSLASIISVLIIWFSLGIFPVYPSIIATGSMIPIFHPGDMVIYQKIEPEKISVGDIVQFINKEKVPVTHRVIEIRKLDRTVFKTKGDNNTVPDNDLVTPEQIKGKAFFTIPKVGWLSLYFKTQESHEKYEF